MKDFKNDSASTLARFGRDKRARTTTASAQRVERHPRSQRDAADSEQPAYGQSGKRTSYNPNFTPDNRPVGDERSQRAYGNKPSYGGKNTYGDKPRYGGGKPTYGDRGTYRDKPAYDEKRTYGDKPRYQGEKPAYGEKPRYEGERPAYGERRSYGGKPVYGEKRTYGDKPRYTGGKPAYGQYGSSDDKPAYGERRTPGSKPGYGDRPAYGDKPRFGDKKYGGKPAFGNSKPGVRPYGPKKPSTNYPRFNPAQQTGEMRLNRFIAQSGICSRREADDFIQAGLVSVNGTVVTELGTKVLPTDEVKFNDSRVQGEKKVYLVLNKPKGYCTTLDDPHADKTVMDLIKGACTERIYPVGRLDKNSVGLLLFTNDGDLTKQLTHPSYQKKKIYQVTLDKPLERADMQAIADGILLEDGEIHADEIAYVKDNKKEVGIEIHSGRNRIVRRIFEHLGYNVLKLDRVYYAGLTKKNLKRGGWRFLTREEVERLKSGQYE